MQTVPINLQKGSLVQVHGDYTWREVAYVCPTRFFFRVNGLGGWFYDKNIFKVSTWEEWIGE